MNHARIRKHFVAQSTSSLMPYAYLGEVLKRVRKEKDLTQEALTNGICSVSYYSKVENNKMKPHTYFISEIGSRLNTDLISEMPGVSDTCVIDRLTDALFVGESDAGACTTMPTNEAVKKTALADVASLVNAVMKKRHARSRRLIKKIEPLINTLYLSTSQVFTIATAIAFYDQCHYKDALDLLRITEETTVIPQKLKALEQHYLYLAKQRLCFPSSATENYLNAREHWRSTNHMTRLSELELYRLYFMVEEDPTLAKQAIARLHERMIPKALYNFHLYILILAAVKAKQDDEAIECLKRVRNDIKDAWYYRIKLMEYRLLFANAPHASHTLTKIFETEDATRHALEEKVRYTVETTRDKEELQDYLRDVAFPLAIERQNLGDMHTYADKLMTLSIESSRYKEALAVKKKHDRALAKIKRIEEE